jgi:hypothetical protein
VSLSIALGIATFIVAASGTALTYRASRREGTADLRLVDHQVYANPRAPLGWQVKASILNRGPADARAASVWLHPNTSIGPPPYDSDRFPKVPPGAGASSMIDLPEGAPYLWLCWRDKRGLQMRNTGVAATPPATE